jgi:hypothetical protein
VCVLITAVIVSLFFLKPLNGTLAISSTDYKHNIPSAEYNVVWYHCCGFSLALTYRPRNYKYNLPQFGSTPSLLRVSTANLTASY